MTSPNVRPVKDLPVIGQRIRRRLRELDRTDAWLAKQLNRDPSTVSYWIHGSRQMTIAQLREVALVLHRSPGWLLGEDDAAVAEVAG